MKLVYRLLVPLSAIVALAFLAGCGPYSTNSSASSSTPPTAVVKSSTPGRIKLIPTPRATPTPIPHSLRTGPVTLNVSASVYQPGATIVFILNNQSGQTIHFQDHLTECTVVFLQYLVNGWTPVAPCRLMTLTRLYSLNPGQDLVVKLIAPRAQGTYQGVLTYFAPGLRRTIFSGDFQVV